VTKAEKRMWQRVNSIVRRGKVWVKTLEREISELPQGIWICINVETGEYVLGSDEGDASKTFRDKFGAKVPAFLHWVGGQIHV